MAQLTPPLDSPANLHTCPKCLSPNIAYDWETLVSLQIKDGKPQWVNLGGCTDTIPLQVFCSDCGLETPGIHLSEAQATAACQSANDLYDATHQGSKTALANGLLLAGSA